VQPLVLNPDMTFALAHTYAAPGEYTVVVTVTSPDSDPASDSFTVTIVQAIQLHDLVDALDALNPYVADVDIPITATPETFNT
jgi:PKD repeat protein